MFIIFSYRNILQQTEIGIRLPDITLVQILNNPEFFTKDPTPEKVDTYLSLGNVFETFKDDYMKHYDEFSLMLYTYITLEESEIAFKFYVHKHFFKKDYMRKDYFSLGTGITEFVKHFYTSDSRSNADIFENKPYKLLWFENNKTKCEEFFNAYVYPLYLAQNKQQEISIGKKMNTVFTLWVALKNCQILIFFFSIVYLLLASFVFALQKIVPLKYFKNQFNVGVLLFIAIISLSISFVLAFTSFFISLSMYHKELNYKGGYNALFNLVQIMYLMLITFFSLNWVKDLRIEISMEEEGKTISCDQIYLLKPLSGHTIKRPFSNFLKNQKKNNDNHASNIVELDISVPDKPTLKHQKIKKIKENAVEREQSGKSKFKSTVQTAKSLGKVLTLENFPSTNATDTDTTQKVDSLSDLISIETSKLLEDDPFHGQTLNMISHTSLDYSTAQIFNMTSVNSSLSESKQIPTEEGCSFDISKDYLTYTNAPFSSGPMSSKLKLPSTTEPRLTEIKENNDDLISSITTPFADTKITISNPTESLTVTGTRTVIYIPSKTNSSTNGNVTYDSVSLDPGTSRHSSSGCSSSQFTKSLSSNNSSKVGLAAMGFTTLKSSFESNNLHKNRFKNGDRLV